MPTLEIAIKIALSAFAFLALSIVFFALILISNRLLRVSADRKHILRIENRGNCRSVYFLTVSSAEPALRFSLFLKDVPLAQVNEPVADSVSQAAPEEMVQAQPPQPASVKGSNGNPSAQGFKPDGALKSGQAASARVGTLASLLGSLGQLIPGPIGAGLRARAGQAREMQTGANRAIQAPQTMKNQVGQIQKDGGRLTGNKPGSEKSAPARTNHSQPLTKVSKTVAAFGGGAVLNRFQTPELDPGQAFDISLRIGTYAKRYPAGSFGYLVRSEQVALDFPDAVGEPFERSGFVFFGEIGAWRYWLPRLASFFFVFLGLFLLFIAQTLIWQ